jgi:hypothetical protein
VNQIVKKTTSTYDVLVALPSKPLWAWGDFKTARENRGLSTGQFAHCFACGRGFADDEQVYFCTIKQKGNRFMCKACAEKYSTEK